MATQVSLNSGAVSSAGSLKLQTNGTTDAVTIDTAQNMGLGVTPSAWGTTLKPFEIGAVGTYISGRPGSNQLDLGVNNYYNAGYKYAAAGQRATQYEQFNGTHSWYYAGVSTNAGDPITFTQAMTLDVNSNLIVGTASVLQTSIGNGIQIKPDSAGGYINIGHASGTASGYGYAQFLYNNGVIGSITQNGTTAVAFNTTSDYRLKNNVRPADAKRFMDIEFVDFEWTDGRHDCGTIAHQLQSVYPDLVIGEKDATEVSEVEITPAVPAVMDDEGNEITPAIPAVTEKQTFPKYQQVNYIGLIPRMGTVIQQQQRLIESLISRIETLEAK